MDASRLRSFAYSINFQIRQIPATNHHFAREKTLCLVGQDFWKRNIIFSGLRSRYHRQTNRKKLILALKKYFKTSKDIIIATASKWLFQSFTFFQSGWDNVAEIWEFHATEVFPDKATPDIGFIYEAA